MTSTAETGTRQPTGFTLFLPPGFIELPHNADPELEDLLTLSDMLGEVFGLAPRQLDQGRAEAVAMLAAMGAAASTGGASYVAAGFFRSPVSTHRPIMVMVSCFTVGSQHSSTNVVIAGLEEIRQNAGGAPEIVDLPAGRSVISQTRESSTVAVRGEPVELVQHAITAWIPDQSGAGVVGVAVTSNNAEDWEHVVDLARGIFETVEWESPYNESTDE